MEAKTNATTERMNDFLTFGLYLALLLNFLLIIGLTALYSNVKAMSGKIEL